MAKISKDSDNGTDNVRKKKNPHPMLLMALVVLFCAVLTYVIPAGRFDRVLDQTTGREVIVPGSFTFIEGEPVNPLELLRSVTLGMQNAGSVIFFLFIIGGMFAVLNGTGASGIGIANILKLFKGREILLIPVLMLLFGAGSAFLGNFEEFLVFVPVILACSITAGFDSLTAVGIIFMAAAAGYGGAVTNAFTVGLAQEIAGLPRFSGMTLRIVLFLVLECASITYVTVMAMMIKKKPETSCVYAYDLEYNMGKRIDVGNLPPVTGRQILALVFFVIGMIWSVVGVINWGYYIDELSAVFLATGVICGIAGKRKAGEICEDFIKGCKDMLTPCIIIGLANAALILFKEANALDTILYGMSLALDHVTCKALPVAMFIFHEIFNVVVPSGSAQAAATMPIMIPLARDNGITAQTAVLAFQLGDAFTNVLAPTGGEILAALAICRIPFRKWVKYLFPLFLIWCVIAVGFLVYAAHAGYGPF